MSESDFFVIVGRRREVVKDVREDFEWNEGAGRTRGSGREERRSGKKGEVSESE